jgi:hypothetical protein
MATTQQRATRRESTSSIGGHFSNEPAGAGRTPAEILFKLSSMHSTHREAEPSQNHFRCFRRSQKIGLNERELRGTRLFVEKV